MWKILSIVLTGICVSLFFFPFEFTFLPGVNTKMMLAVAGIIVALIFFAQKKGISISKGFVNIGVYSLLVSIIGVVSVVVNGTNDFAYATYFVSMSVWLSAAFFTCCLIWATHRKISVSIVINYLMIICVIQCVLALLINQSPVVKAFVGEYFSLQQDFLDASNVKRMYGIGAALDTAGVRFSAVLIMIASELSKRNKGLHQYHDYLYLICFFIITVVGCMISRTTSVGAFISLVVLFRNGTNIFKDKLFLEFLTVLLAAVVIVVYFYNRIPEIERLIQFGFEGFFNLFETGDFSTSSTERLKTMYVFPESLHTWIIGDGYFSNPYLDPYYVGELIGGFYMGTDVGYLRFVFYFGMIGLISFSVFMFVASKECASKSPDYKNMFTAILLLGFLIWLKVSTDVFLVYALFLCVGNMQNSDGRSDTLESEL